jgi:hypothetical protein
VREQLVESCGVALLRALNQLRRGLALEPLRELELLAAIFAATVLLPGAVARAVVVRLISFGVLGDHRTGLT